MINDLSVRLEFLTNHRHRILCILSVTLSQLYSRMWTSHSHAVYDDSILSKSIPCLIIVCIDDADLVNHFIDGTYSTLCDIFDDQWIEICCYNVVTVSDGVATSANCPLHLLICA
jgi:hypothetical protein